jgi:hypothetical protein
LIPQFWHLYSNLPSLTKRSFKREILAYVEFSNKISSKLYFACGDCVFSFFPKWLISQSNSAILRFKVSVEEPPFVPSPSARKQSE